MLFSYNWLSDYIRSNLPSAEKLADSLTMHSFEVEGLESKNNDFILDIDILPDRAHDCLCHLGIAREIGVILNKKNIDYNDLDKKGLSQAKGSLNKVEVKFEDDSLVPRYSAIVIEGIEIKESPQWVKDRLLSVGLSPVNNVVDLTNFVMLETGQPLHAFDYDKIKKHRLKIRKAKKGEKITTLDGEKRELKKGVLIAEDGEKRIIDLVGIIGGKLSEVSSNTKNIVLQAANFDRKSIYLGAKEMKVSTPASDIYSQGIDPNLTKTALERTYFLLKKTGDNVKINQIIDNYPHQRKPKRVRLNYVYLSKIIGKKIERKKVKSILTRLGFSVVEEKHPNLIVEAPTYRLDVSIPEDLVEEIVRIIGFNKISPSFPVLSISPPQKNFNLFWKKKIQDILKELGFAEVYSYSFFGDKEADAFGFKQKRLAELENPISIENKYLRGSLIPNLVKAVRDNQKSHFEEIKLFEIGKIFNGKDFSEKNMIGAVLSTKEKEESQENFYKLKGIIDSLLNKLGISEVWYDDVKATPEETTKKTWRKKLCAEVKVGNEEIGFIGEINPKIYKEFKTSGNIVAFDLDFEKVKELATEEQEYNPISSYPAAVRDLAVLVPLEVKVAEVLNEINALGGELVRDVDLFDVYTGEEISGNRKNLAFHIIYQSSERTLTSNEIDKIHNKIIKGLDSKSQWEVRK